MSQVTLFISAVSNEFAEDAAHAPERARGPGDYRTYLRDKLTCPDVCVKVQEDFIAGGVLTLDKLLLYIKQCDAVIHLVGDMTGAAASAPAVESIFAGDPTISRTLPFAATPAEALERGISYTQWEAYLAVHFAKRLVVCAAEPHAPRAAAHLVDDEQRAHQARHLSTLKELKRYPEISFASREELVIEVLRMLRTILPESQRESLPAAPCRLPYTPLGELFVGRDDFLEDIRARVERAQQSGRWPRHVVHGLGGTGKTRLAVEYAWRYRDRYGAVVLVNGESRETLDRDLASLVGVFHLECDAATPEPQRTQMAVEWLRQHPGWLLVVDNVDTEPARQAVIGRLPDWVNGHVMITARVADWPHDLEMLGVHVLAPADATRFLLDATAARRSPRPDDEAQAHALANDELGALCLALEQAAAYVSKLQISLADYRERWASNAKDVRKRADKSIMRYHEEKEVSLSVATTWHTTVEQLSVAARALLEMLSWMAPDALPPALLDHTEMAEQLRALTDGQDDDVEYATAELRGYSLLSPRQSGSIESAGQLHRLVQLISRDSSSAERRRQTLAAMMRATARHADDADRMTVPVLDQLGPHLSALIAHADAAGITEDLPRLLRARGMLLYSKVLLADAVACFRRMLAIDEAALGTDDIEVAADLRALAAPLLSSDQFAECELSLRRALAIYESHCDANDSRIASALHMLSALLQLDNRPVEAEQMIRRAMAIDETRLAADDPSLAHSLNELARIRWYDGRLEEAESLLRRALAIVEKRHGIDHFATSSELVNLAAVLKDRGAFDEAEVLFSRALAIETTALGADHPTVAVTLNNISQLRLATNRFEEAESLMRQALAINERKLGPNHRNVARDLNNLGSLLMAVNRLEEAELLIRRAMDVGCRTEGPNHPETATHMLNLSRILSATARSREAEELARTALAIRENSFGATSAKTIESRAQLIAVLNELGRADETEPLLRRAIETFERETSGVDDARIAATLGTLGQLLGRTGRGAEGESLLRRSLAYYEAHDGPDHPATANALALFAELLDNDGRGAEAEQILERAASIYERCGDPNRAELAMIIGARGRLLRNLGRTGEAEPLLERALAMNEQIYGPAHLTVAMDLSRLALLRKLTGRVADARALLLRAKEIFESQPLPDAEQLRWVADELRGLDEAASLRSPREASPAT